MPETKGERTELLKAITKLEHEIKSVTGLLASNTDRAVEDARLANAKLKSNVLEAQKALALELLDRKTPRETVGLAEHLAVLKAELLAYCVDKKIESSIWKKLESL